MMTEHNEPRTIEARIQTGAGLGIITMSAAGILAHALGLPMPGTAQAVAAAVGLAAGIAIDRG